MEIARESLDDVLMALYEALPVTGKPNVATRGPTLELLGVAFRIANPRARLSRSENRGKSFSALGELLWYLSGRNDLSFIRAYVPLYEDEAESDGTIHGAYGPRLLNMRNSIDQITNVITLLAKKPTSRRAVIQLFNAEDIDRPHVEVPCTTTMQFFIRDEKVHMCTTMRSNDAYLGLPHDVFCFTMIQEMIANKLEKGLGEYVHFVGSMHLYTDDIPKLAKYIGEGYHKLAEMPAMPEGNPFELVPTLLAAEDRARRGEVFDALSLLDDPYWADLVRLLQAFWARGQNDRLDQLSAELHHRIYQPYLESRRGKPGHQNDGNAA